MPVSSAGGGHRQEAAVIRSWTAPTLHRTRQAEVEAVPDGRRAPLPAAPLLQRFPSLGVGYQGVTRIHRWRWEGDGSVCLPLSLVDSKSKAQAASLCAIFLSKLSAFLSLCRSHLPAPYFPTTVPLPFGPQYSHLHSLLSPPGIYVITYAQITAIDIHPAFQRDVL